MDSQRVSYQTEDFDENIALQSRLFQCYLNLIPIYLLELKTGQNIDFI